MKKRTTKPSTDEAAPNEQPKPKPDEQTDPSLAYALEAIGITLEDLWQGVGPAYRVYSDRVALILASGQKRIVPLTNDDQLASHRDFQSEIPQGLSV